MTLEGEKQKKWGDKETEILKSNFETKSYSELEKLLPKRTEKAIRKKLSRLKLRHGNRKTINKLISKGLIEYHKNHEVKNTKHAKRRLLREIKNCQFEDCTINIIELLELHHIDGNSKNNKRDNTILLCPNHHKMADLGIIGKEKLRDILNKMRKKV